MSRLLTVTVAFDVKRHSSRLFPVLPKPEVVVNGQTVAGSPYIVLKSNRTSGTASSFMRFSAHFYFWFKRRR